MMDQGVFGWTGAGSCTHHSDIVDPLLGGLTRAGARSVLDIGCGNGSLTRRIASGGFNVVGIEPDDNGLQLARTHDGDYRKASVYDEPGDLGMFDAVVCAEVIEHLFDPTAVPRFAAKVLEPGGTLIITTPFHGYFKNLLIAASGGWDRHVEPLHGGGHIKFFSKSTLADLLIANQFTPTAFEGCGRAPFLWRSMIMTATRNA